MRLFNRAMLSPIHRHILAGLLIAVPLVGLGYMKSGWEGAAVVAGAASVLSGFLLLVD